MPQDDSDSSSDDSSIYTTTNVLLGYASKESTEDNFSQLGGIPLWPTPTSLPSSTLARCKACSTLMPLLLQLHADLPAHFPAHERRLYIFSCKRKACRRKPGSVRVSRGTKTAERIPREKDQPTIKAQQKTDDRRREEQGMSKPDQGPGPGPGLGDSIFGSRFTPTSPGGAGQNPFARTEEKEAERPLNGHSHRPLGNPFAPELGDVPVHKNADAPTTHPDPNPDTKDLPALFSDKARIAPSSGFITKPDTPPTPTAGAPWPTEQNDLPRPYPAYHLDADYETLDPTPAPSAGETLAGDMEIDPSDSSNDVFDKEAFESSLDKTFQKFADRIGQNPEQVLRYEYGGQPLLYSTTDAVGKLFHHAGGDAGEGKVKTTGGKARGMPKCENCGAGRAFEVQLVPEAISQLEVEEDGLDGMEWGTVLVGVCSKDCAERGAEKGEWGWMEEWAGVQWEEVTKPGKA